MHTQFFSEYPLPHPLPGLSLKGLEVNKINQTCQSLQHTDMTLYYELMPHWKSPNAFDSSKKMSPCTA